VANDADAAERTVNDSTTLLPPPATRVDQLRESTQAPPRSNRDARPNTTPSTADKQADGEVFAGAATISDGEERTETEKDASKPHARAPDATSGIRLALILGMVIVLALGGLAGWLGYGVYQARQEENTRNLFLAAGKQGALNLTTINYTQADIDIRRILDSSIGQFYDDFSKRAPAFIDVVKQAQAKTDGSIVEAGLESVNGDSARVLVAVLVTTSNKGATDQQPRHWRMRIDVQKVGDAAKVANVGFVP
jgi:Mce-associated membrane protein